MGDPPPLMVKVYFIHAGEEYTNIYFLPKHELSGPKGGLIRVLIYYNIRAYDTR